MNDFLVPVDQLRNVCGIDPVGMTQSELAEAFALWIMENKEALLARDDTALKPLNGDVPE